MSNIKVKFEGTGKTIQAIKRRVKREVIEVSQVQNADLLVTEATPKTLTCSTIVVCNSNTVKAVEGQLRHQFRSSKIAISAMDSDGVVQHISAKLQAMEEDLAKVKAA